MNMGCATQATECDIKVAFIVITIVLDITW